MSWRACLVREGRNYVCIRNRPGLGGVYDDDGRFKRMFFESKLAAGCHGVRDGLLINVCLDG